MRLGSKVAALTLWGLCAAGCNDANPAKSAAPSGGGDSAGGSTGTSTRVSITSDPTAGQTPAETQYASSPPPPPPSGGAGAGGTSGMMPSGSPFGTSTRCGDAIAGPTEECDDGDEGSDACTAACQTRDEAAVANAVGSSPERYLGAGRHPVSGLDQGFATTNVEFPNGDPGIGVSLFDIWGKRTRHVDVSDGGSPIEQSNPVVAALPGGVYATAWTDFDSDTADLGIGLRLVNADGSLGPLQFANQTTDFTQQNPDLLWTGTQLVAAWEDFSNADTGPDLRYRLFDANLNPLSDEQALAATALPEGAVALAPFNGSFAAAYFETALDGSETVVVSAGGKTFRMGPVFGGPPEDRPALAALDATHLLVVFSAGTDPGAIGLNNTPRLRYSVINTASMAAPTFQALDPLDDLYTLDTKVSELSPAIAPGPDGTNTFYVAWRSEARANDAAGDQLWLKYLSWDVNKTPQLEAREAEVLLPRTCENSIGDQRTPALAKVALPPSGALAMAWDDYSHSQGANAGDPDVVVHYAPLHPRDLTQGSVVAEPFTANNGSTWSSHWSSELTPAAPFTIDVQNKEGRVLMASAAQGVMYVNDHSALNAELVTKVRFNLNGEIAALIARRTDADSDSYLGASIATNNSGPMKVFAKVDNVQTDLATLNLASTFQFWAQGVDLYFKSRFTTNADGSVTVQAKYWVYSLPEPASWALTGTIPASTTPGTPLDNARLRLANTTGRFGVYAQTTATTRTITFDDFNARFFEGTVAGNLDSGFGPALPLLRAHAAYRLCKPGSTCTVAQGCCTGAADCAAGLTCTKQNDEVLGVGSHACVCNVNHCVNQQLDAASGETQVDCGGPDCPACACTHTVARGAVGYATSTCQGGVGDSDCNTNADCLPGLICGVQNGYRYGWPQNYDACQPQHCFDRVQDADELGVDWGGTCGSVQCSGSANGGYLHCTQSCPCAKGNGDCDFGDQCQTGLVCGIGKGPQFGITGDACVPQHCTNGVKDLDETKVDCGGADCGTVCP